MKHVLIMAVVLVLNTACSLPWNAPFEGGVAIGDWQVKYTVSSLEGGNRDVYYEYPYSSKTEVEAAVMALNHAAAQFARNDVPFKATLVFAHPLSIEEFTAFIHTTNIQPVSSMVRLNEGILSAPAEYMQDARGRFLIGQPKPGGKPIDPQALTNITSGGKALKVIGVVSTDTTLNAATYEKARHDPRVYAIDVLAQMLLDDIRHQRPRLRSEELQIRNSLLYGAMEETGIVPKPK